MCLCTCILAAPTLDLYAFCVCCVRRHCCGIYNSLVCSLCRSQCLLAGTRVCRKLCKLAIWSLTAHTDKRRTRTSLQCTEPLTQCNGKRVAHWGLHIYAQGKRNECTQYFVVLYDRPTERPTVPGSLARCRSTQTSYDDFHVCA